MSLFARPGRFSTAEVVDVAELYKPREAEARGSRSVSQRFASLPFSLAKPFPALRLSLESRDTELNLLLFATVFSRNQGTGVERPIDPRQKSAVKKRSPCRRSRVFANSKRQTGRVEQGRTFPFARHCLLRPGKVVGVTPVYLVPRSPL